jgi:hypothetical protein
MNFKHLHKGFGTTVTNKICILEAMANSAFWLVALRQTTKIEGL